MVQFANFDGSQGTVVVSGYRGVGADRERSISFWIRTTQEDLSTICWWGDDLTERTVEDGSENRVRLFQGHIELFGKGSFRRSATKINDGSFHHIAFTWAANPNLWGHGEDFQVANVYVDSSLDNGTLRGQSKRIIFPDGTERTTTAVDTPTETEVIIGARPNASGVYQEFFQGDLDEFAVYDVVLSSGTIQGLYNSGVRGVDLLSLDQAASLQFWYRMGDDPGDVVPAGGVPFGTFVDQNPFTQRPGVVSSGVTIS